MDELSTPMKQRLGVFAADKRRICETDPALG
jgi:hypothetical protein